MKLNAKALCKTTAHATGFVGLAACLVTGMTTIGYLAYRGYRMFAYHEIDVAYDRGQTDGIAYGKRFGRAEGLKAGQEGGYQHGHMEGYDKGYDAGYLAGKDGKPYEGHTARLLEEYGAPGSGEPSHDVGFADIERMFRERDAKRMSEEISAEACGAVSDGVSGGRFAGTVPEADSSVEGVSVETTEGADDCG